MTWTLGRLALVRSQRAARERAEAARLAVVAERTRIAREMHDIVAHSLAVVVRQAEGGAFVADRDPSAAERVLQTIADTGRSALTDMRGLLGVLRGPDGEHDGDFGEAATPPPQPGLTELAGLLTGIRTSGVDAALTESGAAFTVGPATELAVYRLVQEGLTNTVKHAGPRARVTVTLCWGPRDLLVEVVDDGGGERTAAPLVPGAGAGLHGLRERVAAVGGTIDAGRRERGFSVRARFPQSAVTR